MIAGNRGLATYRVRMAAERPRGLDYARADLELARWLAERDRDCSPARVRGWRRAGLLPPPGAAAERKVDRSGRPPAAWASEQLHDVRALALALVTATGRGKSNTYAALRLAAAGLPVPASTVLRAAQAHVTTMHGAVQRMLGSAGPVILGDADPDERLDQIDAFANAHPGVERMISHQLGNPARRDGHPDALSVFSLLLRSGAGLPPEPSDDPTIELALQAFGVHGLLETVGGPQGPRALPNGARDAAPAFALLDVAQLSSLIADIDPATVHPTLRATRELGEAFAAVPPDARHHVAADVLAPMLLDDDPTAIVLRLVCFQALRRDRGVEPDVTPFVQAVRQRTALEARHQ